MVSTISADIVRSTSLKTKDLIELRNELQRLFVRFEKKYYGFWARIVKGDGIECFVPECKYVLRIAILIKLYVKMHVDNFDCHELLQKHGIRFSIGVADIKYADKKEDIINGPAIYMSGRNLDEISKNSTVYTAFEMDNVSDELNGVLDSYVAMLNNIVDAYSAKQSEVIFYKLQGYKEIDISELLGIYQSSVNTRATKAQWGLVNMAMIDFENLVTSILCI